MSSHVEVITTPTADTPGTTFILRTQKQHYIFGSHAEGTQRAMTQMGTRLTKVQDFFITGKMEWGNTGGLIGLALTLADSATSSYETSLDMWRKAKEAGKKGNEPQAPKLNLYGPPNLKHMLGTCRRFIFRKGLPITATEYKNVAPTRSEKGNILPTWQDANIQVWALPVTPSRQDPQADSRIEMDLASKREAYDQFLNHFEEHKVTEGESAEEREERYEKIRAATVNSMFNSNWSFDTLVERHISEVEMPAAMFIRNPETNRFDPYTGPKPGENRPLPDIVVWTRTPWPGARIIALPPTRPAPESISYIVKTHSARGAFDVSKAKALGIKPGPNYSKLTAGQSIQNENGDTITSNMVMGPERPGQGVAILDVPSLEYLEAIVQREELREQKVMTGIGACFWMLGPGLSSHPLFLEFTRKLEGIQHVISSIDDCPNRLALDSATRQTAMLAQIDPVRYHIPFHDNISLPQNSLLGLGAPKPDSTRPAIGNIIAADRGLLFNLMPKFEKRKDTIPPLLSIQEVEQATSPEIVELAKIAQQTTQNEKEALQKWKGLVARPDTEVITLGTGSALPSKYRNVSATLVRVPGVGNYLFDCGENTLGQLQRLFPPEELVEVIKELRVIWISHLHADHHLGTAGLIRAWYRLVHDSIPASSPPSVSTLSSNASQYGLSIISHEGMLRWLFEYSAIEDFGFSRVLPFQISPVSFDLGDETTSTLTLTLGPTPIAEEGDNFLRKEDYAPILGLQDIQAVRVAHCYGAMAVSMTFPQNPSDHSSLPPLKVSYSGDCRPSLNFAKIGKDTTVLIHEATFDDELAGDARTKKHSTTSEALAIGAKMNAKAVVLTHFSQRYQKIPVLQTVQDGEAEDELLNGNFAAEEPQEEEDNDNDRMEENPDIYTSTNRDTGPSVPFEKPFQPPQLKHQASSTLHEHERIIRVRSRDMKVAIAFDYMRVKVGAIAELEHFNDALNKLLIKEEEIEGAVNEVNSNGKRASEDDGEGKSGGKKSKKEKKSKRNN